MAPKKSKAAQEAPKEKPPPAAIAPPLTNEDLTVLQQTTGFNSAELNWIHRIYAPCVTPDDTSRAHYKTLGATPELTVHPLIERVLLMHNEDKSGQLSFGEFANAMRSLGARATLEQKLRFVFDLFDMNGSGSIQTVEMFQILRMMLGRAVSDGALQEITDNYLRRFPSGLTFDVFSQMFDVADLNKVVLSL